MNNPSYLLVYIYHALSSTQQMLSPEIQLANKLYYDVFETKAYYSEIEESACTESAFLHITIFSPHIDYYFMFYILAELVGERL